MTEIDAFVHTHTPALAAPDMNNFEGSDDAAAVSTSADEANARKAAACVSEGIELLLLALTAKGELRDDDCTSARLHPAFWSLARGADRVVYLFFFFFLFSVGVWASSVNSPIAQIARHPTLPTLLLSPLPPKNAIAVASRRHTPFLTVRLRNFFFFSHRVIISLSVIGGAADDSASGGSLQCSWCGRTDTPQWRRCRDGS